MEELKDLNALLGAGGGAPCGEPAAPGGQAGEAPC